jgi:hypothetical protein
MNVAALSKIEASRSNAGMKIPLIQGKLNPSGQANPELNTELNREMCRDYRGDAHGMGDEIVQPSVKAVDKLNRNHRKPMVTSASNRSRITPLIRGNLSPRGYGNPELNTELNREMCRAHRGSTHGMGDEMCRTSVKAEQH